MESGNTLSEVDPAKGKENEVKEQSELQKAKLEKESLSETEMNEDESDDEDSLPDARLILHMCDVLFNKIQQRDERIIEKDEKISFLEKELDMELKLGQEREDQIISLEKSCKQLSDENASLKDEIQKLKMGWPTPTETMSARQCARRMQQSMQMQNEWRAPFGFEKIRQNRHIRICLRCRRQGHHFKDCPYAEFCSYCQREGHRDATHNVATWACQRE